MDLGFATHGVHMDQKLVQLQSTLSRNKRTLQVIAPRDGQLFSPGPGFLFVVTDGGVPSVGHRVIIGTGASPPVDQGAIDKYGAFPPPRERSRLLSFLVCCVRRVRNDDWQCNLSRVACSSIGRISILDVIVIHKCSLFFFIHVLISWSTRNCFYETAITAVLLHFAARSQDLMRVLSARCLNVGYLSPARADGGSHKQLRPSLASGMHALRIITAQ